MQSSRLLFPLLELSYAKTAELRMSRLGDRKASLRSSQGRDYAALTKKKYKLMEMPTPIMKTRTLRGSALCA
jgi:hypothetical protein